MNGFTEHNVKFAYCLSFFNKKSITVPVFMIKGIGKRLQNEETEPKPLVSGYPKAYVCTSRGEVYS